MDYKKLKRLFKDGEYQFIDALINVDLDLISKIDPMMIKKTSLNMRTVSINLY